MTTIITTPGKYRTRSGEVAEITKVCGWWAHGLVTLGRHARFPDGFTLRRKWHVLESHCWAGSYQLDIVAKIDGGAE